MRRGVVLVGLFVTLSAVAGDAPKPAWQWTVEERIASRTSAPLAHKRVDARRVEATGSAQRDGVVDEFTGKTNPELFLPHEVFAQLIDMGFAGDARMNEGARKALMRDVQRHGLPDDFWEQLRTASTVYISDMLAVRELNAQPVRPENARRRTETLAIRNRESCRSKVDALTAAREKFGRERFDRFLYEVVAVKMFHFSDKLPDPAQLRFVAGGCR